MTLALGLASVLSACNDTTSTTVPNRYTETKLVADASALGAAHTDARLVNPWGLAFDQTGILWVANNHTGTSTRYDANGVVQSGGITIPTSGAPVGGAPTGIVHNVTSDFTIPGLGTAVFIYAGEDGVISAWNANTVNAVTVADRSSNNAVYKGLAIASNGGVNRLYATNFKQNAVDVFDGNFQFVTSFTDANLPAGYAPFGIENVGGKLYVTFAKQLAPDNEDDDPGVGHGYVDVFNPDGTLFKRFASTGTLNSPWAVAVAPVAGFDPFSGAILIGNFGDGHIGAYDPATGDFLGLLRDANGTPIAIDGLWALEFGPGTSSTTLYFTAGPSDETQGLLGTLTPAG